MKMKLYTSKILALLAVGMMLALPIASVQAWGWRPTVTKIAIHGTGFPGSLLKDDRIKCLPGDNVLVWRERNFYPTIWVGDDSDPDPRLTWTSPIADGENYCRFTMIVDATTYIPNDPMSPLDGVIMSKEILRPGAYWDAGTGTWTGWWETYSWGKLWLDFANQGPFGPQYYEFHKVMYGRGVFQGLKLVYTVSVANVIETDFEIQGYLIDMT